MAETQFNVDIPLLAKDAVARFFAYLHIKALAYSVVRDSVSVKITSNFVSRCTQSKVVLKAMQLALIRCLALNLRSMGYNPPPNQPQR
jgi:hypothetical protein